MRNDNLIKQSILLDLSLALNSNRNMNDTIKDVLLKIVKAFNCCSGIIYILDYNSKRNITLKAINHIPYNILNIEKKIGNFIDINREYNTTDFQQLLNSLPQSFTQNDSHLNFIPIGHIGILVLEKKDKSISTNLLKMLTPILNSVEEKIINNTHKVNLKAFRNLFENIDEFVVMYDRNSKKIIDGNISFWKILKREDNPPINELLKTFLKINENDNLDQEIEKILQPKLTPNTLTYDAELITPSGKIPISLRPLTKSKDISDKIAFIMKDISLRQELEKQKQILDNNQRLISLGELAGNIAHEINNPLLIISGITEIINMTINNNKKINLNLLKNNINNINSSVKRINATINGLKTMSRDGNLEDFKLTPIYTIVDDALEVGNELICKYNIKTEYNRKNSLINCKISQISQILINLISNSIHAIQKSSEKWIRIQEEEHENQIQIRITDSGKGIPKELRNKIMDRYFTTKPPGEGTGIGLSLSKQIMELHKGNLYYDEHHPNTSFILEFPK